MDFVRGNVFVEIISASIVAQSAADEQIRLRGVDRRKHSEEILSKFKKNKEILFLTCIPYSNINIANSDI